MPVTRRDDRQYSLAVNATATGAAVSIPGGEYAFTLDALTNTGSVQLQMQTPSGAWLPVSLFANNLVATSNTGLVQTAIDLPACNVRVAVASGAVTGLNASLIGLG